LLVPKYQRPAAGRSSFGEFHRDKIRRKHPRGVTHRQQLGKAVATERGFATVRQRGGGNMKHTSAAALGILVSFAACPANADTITDWNQTAIAVLKTANVAGNPWTRSMAMVHVAMSDAVNSVQGRYARYVAKGELARDASVEVAAASAARQILLQLYPAQKAAIDEAFS